MLEVVDIHILELVEVASLHVAVGLAQHAVLLLAALELGDVQASAVFVVLTIFSALKELLQLHRGLALDIPCVLEVPLSGLAEEELQAVAWGWGGLALGPNFCEVKVPKRLEGRDSF